MIYDREGVLLAENIAAFRLEVVPEQVADIEALLEDLRDTIGISDDDIDRFKALAKSEPSYQSVPLRLKLTEEDIALFAVDRWRYQGVDVVPYLTRYYPRGKTFGHLVGYVGRIDDADVKRLDESRYAGTTHAARQGSSAPMSTCCTASPAMNWSKSMRIVDPCACWNGSRRPQGRTST